MCMGYVKGRTDLSRDAAVWRQSTGLLDTGDVGRLDEDGYLYITGRKKRFIKCNGVRISLDELERSIENRWKVPVVCIAKVISIGKQSFSALREQDYFFVDKTNLIKEWWEKGDDITLIARPRRFGKMLNMSMLPSAVLTLEENPQQSISRSGFIMALYWDFWWNCGTGMRSVPTEKVVMAGMMLC